MRFDYGIVPRSAEASFQLRAMNCSVKSRRARIPRWYVIAVFCVHHQMRMGESRSFFRH